jgi:hypothetical protein
MPHMHLRGKDMKYEVIYPSGKARDFIVGAAIPVQLADRLSFEESFAGSQRIENDRDGALR